ncbi:MAG: type III secretion system chaperone [Kiritimatiellae bacterium]|nr:type III secretion system chaperone [Kiritimatiellia bacterium]
MRDIAGRGGGRPHRHPPPELRPPRGAARDGRPGRAPPEGREALYKTLLEANDLFAGTLGATLSLNPANGRIRLQRFDDGTVFGDIKDNGKRLEHVQTHGRFVFNPEYKAVE